MSTLYRRRLPHLRDEGGVYFLTWSLADRDRPLSDDERTIVVDALRYFDGQRYDVYASVVMDDHVHVVVHPLSGFTLSAITHTWKSFAAHRILRLRGQPGPLWQAEGHDRLIRDDDELSATCLYVAQNPAKRWPQLETYCWMYPVLGLTGGPTGGAPAPRGEGDFSVIEEG